MLVILIVDVLVDHTVVCEKSNCVGDPFIYVIYIEQNPRQNPGAHPRGHLLVWMVFHLLLSPVCALSESPGSIFLFCFVKEFLMCHLVKSLTEIQ